MSRRVCISCASSNLVYLRRQVCQAPGDLQWKRPPAEILSPTTLLWSLKRFRPVHMSPQSCLPWASSISSTGLRKKLVPITGTCMRAVCSMPTSWSNAASISSRKGLQCWKNSQLLNGREGCNSAHGEEIQEVMGGAEFWVLRWASLDYTFRLCFSLEMGLTCRFVIGVWTHAWAGPNSSLLYSLGYPWMLDQNLLKLIKTYYGSTI